MTEIENTVCPNCAKEGEPTDSNDSEVTCTHDPCAVSAFDGNHQTSSDGSRYEPEPREYEQKDFLYEHYWGQFKSTHQIADECGVSHSTIRTAMQDNGIPCRVDGYTRDNCVSAFRGFYNVQPAHSDGESNQQFEADYDATDDESEWMYGWRQVSD